MTEPESMLAATYTQGGAFSIEEIPVPRIESDEILLRVRAAAICATDTKIVRSGHRKLVEGQRIVGAQSYAVFDGAIRLQLRAAGSADE